MQCFVTSVLLAALAGPLTAQTVVTRKLSGPMATGAVGDVGEIVLGPTADRVLYQVLRGAEVPTVGGPAELVVAPVDGSVAPITLTQPGGGDVVSLRWTPDGTRAVYVTGPSSSSRLHSVLADGSAPPTLLFASTPSLQLDPSFQQSVQLAVGGFRVVYLAGAQVYSAPVDGSAPAVRLNDPLPGGRTVSRFATSPTSSRVVYSADANVHLRYELFSVPADGSSAPIQLSQTFGSAGSVSGNFSIDPSATRVVYRGYDASNTLHVFSAPLDGSSAPVQLSPALPAGGATTSFVVSPDGARVITRASLDAALEFELFLAPIDGSALPVKLTPVPTGGAVLDGYQFSPDSTHVVCEVDWNGVRLVSVRTSDAHVELLHATDVESFQLVPDSSRVVFELASRELWSVPIDGSSPAVRINPDLVPAGGEVEAYAVTSDSLQVVYRADAETIDVPELYRVATVPSGPPVATKLDPVPVPGGRTGRFALVPGGASVVYAADAFTDGVTELLRSSLAGAPAPAVLSTPLPTAVVGDVASFVERAGRVVYVADQDTDEQLELHGVPSDGSSAPVELSGTLVSGGDVGSPVLTADGSTVVYIADGAVDGRYELYSAPTDGSAPSVKLNQSLVASADVYSFRISPDGTRVVYPALQTGMPEHGLHSVPIHGGSSNALGPLVTEFEITPDSNRVLFTDGRLYSVPIDGSTAPVDISGVVGVAAFEATPDSSRVVYRLSNGALPRLFSSSILGGSPTNLSGMLVFGGGVTDFEISPDGQRVVYRADAFVDDRFLLFSAPIDGSSPAIVLNGPLIGGGDVHEFEVSPDGVHVVYLADQAVDGSERLYRVPLDGSAPDVQLSTQDLGLAPFAIAPDGANIVVAFDGLRSLPITGGSLVQLSSSASEFAFLPGGRRVVHVEPDGLKLTAITGGTPVALSPDPAGSILEFALDGTRVVYRADQDSADVLEIHASGLNIPPVEHAPPAKSRSATR